LGQWLSHRDHPGHPDSPCHIPVCIEFDDTDFLQLPLGHEVIHQGCHYLPVSDDDDDDHHHDRTSQRNLSSTRTKALVDYFPRTSSEYPSDRFLIMWDAKEHKISTVLPKPWSHDLDDEHGVRTGGKKKKEDRVEKRGRTGQRRREYMEYSLQYIL
jgi:hypothetical protein